MVKRHLICSVAFLGLAACAPTQLYHPIDNSGGYTDTPLARDTWRVTAQGYNGTVPDKIERLALFRAANLTLEQGFDKFAVIGGNGVQLNNQLIGYDYPASFNDPFYSGFGGRRFYSGFGYGAGIARPIIDRTPYGSIVVRMYDGSDRHTHDAANALDARRIVDDLGPEFWPRD